MGVIDQCVHDLGLSESAACRKGSGPAARSAYQLDCLRKAVALIGIQKAEPACKFLHASSLRPPVPSCL